jgi:hypothetical protein
MIFKKSEKIKIFCIRNTKIRKNIEKIAKMEIIFFYYKFEIPKYFHATS